MEIKTLKDLQDKFNSVKNTVSNKELFIENELKNIDNYLRFDLRNFQRAKKHRFDFSKPNEEHIFEINIELNFRDKFSKVVKEFNIYDKKLDLDLIENETDKELSKQAYEFSKYINWLREQRAINTVRFQSKKSNLTHAQKILALYYLGIDMRKFQNNVKSAKILSSILDLDESNTKDYLTYFEGKKSKVKNKSNINKMLELFEPQEFKKILNKVEEDL